MFRRFECDECSRYFACSEPINPCWKHYAHRWLHAIYDFFHKERQVQEKYAVVAVFSHRKDGVLLIHKKRPAWQCGKFNLPGGHVESNETFEEAAVRELWEETGLKLLPADLELLLQMDHPDHRLECFTAVLDITKAEQKTDEHLMIANPKNLPVDVLRSARWWIGLALDESACKPIVYRDLNGREENHEG